MSCTHESTSVARSETDQCQNSVVTIELTATEAKNTGIRSGRVCCPILRTGVRICLGDEGRVNE